MRNRGKKTERKHADTDRGRLHHRSFVQVISSTHATFFSFAAITPPLVLRARIFPLKRKPCCIRFRKDPAADSIERSMDPSLPHRAGEGGASRGGRRHWQHFQKQISRILILVREDARRGECFPSVNLLTFSRIPKVRSRNSRTLSRQAFYANCRNLELFADMTCSIGWTLSFKT